MNNRDLQQAWRYHERTKHSAQSIRADPHGLDWENLPLLFKVYSDLEPIPFPRDTSIPEMGTLEAISVVETGPAGPYIPDLGVLGRLLLLSAGITKKRGYAGGEMYFRAAACTGALYHIDLYLVCGPLPGLEAGVYHFGPQDFSLRRLRSGDFRASLIHASGREPSVEQSPAVLVSATTFWRNSWKYRARAYRHGGWDNGTILANLLAAAAGHGVPATAVCGFVDDEVNRLLDLEEGREAALSLIPLGGAGGPPGAPPEVAPLSLKTVPLSKRMADYPAIREMHAASSLPSSEEAAAWRGRTPASRLPAPTGKIFPLKPDRNIEAVDDRVSDVILRRGSTREFAREPITFGQLSTALDRAIRGFPADFLEPPDALLNDVYLIVHAVDGLPSGAYVYRREEKSLELLREGDFRRQAGHLGLGQQLPADASVNVYFMLDLDPVLERFGNRGYRAAQLEAGVLGGRLYLAAYAQRFGATGLTFFDDDVTEFFSPHARGKSVMFLMALGRKLKRPKR
ncbi:MAG: SagB/ThcOx family dehydrogenase [Nitrospinota bacterium]